MNEKYTLEVTEEQLQLIANCVEDLCRFVSGQTGLDNTTIGIVSNRDYRKLAVALEQLTPFVTPHLGKSQYYGWDGGDCPNEEQRKFIAKTYGIYREIRHFLAVTSGAPAWSTYLSPTLTCEDSVPLPIIKVKE